MGVHALLARVNGRSVAAAPFKHVKASRGGGRRRSVSRFGAVSFFFFSLVVVAVLDSKSTLILVMVMRSDLLLRKGGRYVSCFAFYSSCFACVMLP